MTVFVVRFNDNIEKVFDDRTKAIFWCTTQVLMTDHQRNKLIEKLSTKAIALESNDEIDIRILEYKVE
jgi:hypothetical protein